MVQETEFIEIKKWNLKKESSKKISGGRVVVVVLLERWFSSGASSSSSLSRPPNKIADGLNDGPELSLRQNSDDSFVSGKEKRNVL